MTYQQVISTAFTRRITTCITCKNAVSLAPLICIARRVWHGAGHVGWLHCYPDAIHTRAGNNLMREDQRQQDQCGNAADQAFHNVVARTH